MKQKKDGGWDEFFIISEQFPSSRVGFNRTIDKYGNQINNYVCINRSIDYSNTWFHNAINVKHYSDLSQAIRYSQSMQSSEPI